MANLITFARIALIIPFMIVFLAEARWNMNGALVIFTVAALSDFLDGYVARARNEVSALGAALDPLADKLLVTAALILLIRNGMIREAGVIAAILIVLREILVSGLREAVARAGGTLDVTGLAKFKTTAQLVAVGLILLAAPTGFVGPSLAAAASGVLWLSAVLTVWTGADYTRKAVIFLNRHEAAS